MFPWYCKQVNFLPFPILFLLESNFSAYLDETRIMLIKIVIFFSEGIVTFTINRAMKVSAKAEYACVAMVELAANRLDSQPVRVKAIADAHGIPLRFLVQILLQLKGAGLVASIRGAAGGYQLARRPTEISLADII